MGATMKDIARVTGLGLATISSYLNSERFKDKPDKDDWDHHSGAEQHFLCRDYYRSGRCASKSWICNDDL